MRRALLSLLAAMALSGCIETLQGMYDEQARSDCDEISNRSERSSCHDRVDQNRRERP